MTIEDGMDFISKKFEKHKSDGQINMNMIKQLEHKNINHHN